MRFIRLNESNKITSIREGKVIVNGEIQSDMGKLGQIMQEDGTFSNDERDFIFSKQDKISLLSRECGERIVNGIDFTWEGETHHYSLDITDQMEINILRLNVMNGAEFTTWHYNGGQCETWSAEKFLNFANQALTFATYTKVRFNTGIRPLVESMEDLAEINAVTLDTELSAEVEAKIMELVSITLTGQ